MSSQSSELAKATPERVAELRESLSEIRAKVSLAAGGADLARAPTLVAVSKYKPASDIAACFEHAGHRDFGENYVQELVEKAEQLPQEIRWHFIGTLQSNKAKTLASIPNLYAIQTLTSEKAANALNKALPPERVSPLYVLLQVNTSGEEAKSGLNPLNSGSDVTSSPLVQLAKHIIDDCPRLRLQGLMTIGSLEASLASDVSPNHDFETLVQTRDTLHVALKAEKEAGQLKGEWGASEDGRLLLSMGMSADFEAALQAGANIVRVGSSIFGARKSKEEVKAQETKTDVEQKN
jgi:pyridoxal phosphate enzyme (YggS family)